MAFRTEKCVYYHIPKTGGQWVRRALMLTGRFEKTREHTPLLEIRKLRLQAGHKTPYGACDDVDGLFSFTFVRRPYYWYQSYWASRMKQEKFDNFLLGNVWDNNFENFISQVIKKYPTGFLTKIYQYYVGKDGRMVDFVGRQENLKNDLIKALKKSGETFDESKLRKLPEVNVTPNKEELNINANKKLITKLRNKEVWILKTFY